MNQKERFTQPDSVHPFEYGNQSALEAYIRQYKEPVDYSRIVSSATRVLSPGERHNCRVTKREVTESLALCKSLGFTHLAIEALSIEAQGDLDEFQHAARETPELCAHFEDFGWLPDYYFKLIRQAREIGLKILGIDMPAAEQQQYGDVVERIHQRDNRMAQTIRLVLDENQHNRIITFTGSAHAGKEETSMATQLMQSGVRITSVKICSVLFRRSSAIDDAIHAIAPGERFMIACRARFPDEDIPFDWVIHLPQPLR